jgi:hypothetical protein
MALVNPVANSLSYQVIADCPNIQPMRLKHFSVGYAVVRIFRGT